MNINSRFNKIINTCYSGNKRSFALSVGISPSVVENVVGQRSGKPSFDVLEKVCANANINPEWLLTGSGTMLKSGDEVLVKAPPPPHNISSDTMIMELIRDNGDLREEIGNLKKEVEILRDSLKKRGGVPYASVPVVAEPEVELDKRDR
jgi:hypothetical protein